MSLMKFKKSKPKSTATFAPGGQGLFLKKPSLDPAKTFHWDVLDTLLFFASLRVSSRLKSSGGFRERKTVEKYLGNVRKYSLQKNVKRSRND